MMASWLTSIDISERWFNRLVIGVVTFGFLAVLAAGVAATQAILENERHSFWVNHTYRVEHAVSDYRALIDQAEAARRGYLLRGDAVALSSLDQSTKGVLPALADVRRLTSDNPAQASSIARMEALSRQLLTSFRRSVNFVRLDRRGDAIREFRAPETIMLVRTIHREIATIMERENRLLVDRNAAQEASLRRFFIILAGAGVLLMIVGMASIWMILRYTRDLTFSRNALRTLAANLEGAVGERTEDLQRANEEIQRFAYIVSHDLRAPLVNVMGFTAELEASTAALTKLVDRVEQAEPDELDPEARDAVRIDLPEAIGFIRTSTEKMDRLINAILRLSREGRRPLTAERIDMAALLRGIADTLHHRVAEIGAEIVVAPVLPEIASDRIAVEQIFSNLIENAVKYLTPDRPGRIEVTGRIAGARAVFDVIDNGRGIDPKDHQRIFDLFRRSGVQDQPGEGIGLAHTRTLAYRLGGTIGVESQLDAGATFRVSLPIVFTGEQRPTQ